MNNTKETGKTAFGDTAMESGAKKVGESVANRALNSIADFVINKYGEAKVILGTAFQLCLKNATERYNQVRTLATGQAPRKIIGQDNIYVNVGLQYEGEKSPPLQLILCCASTKTF